jgi:NADPH-dependent ferric siderophore reductase
MVNWQRGVMRLMRITNHEVIVTGVEDFTATYRRIHFSGPELLAQLDEVFPTLWTRLWFPHPEKGEGHLSQRGYTFAATDREAGTFSLDFVLHGDLGQDASAGTADIGTAGVGTADIGPGARWAAQARPGTRIEAALTPARIDLPDDTSHLLLAGDLTALPAINSWCEAVPAEVAVTVAIVAEPEEVLGLPVSSHPNSTWDWVNPASSAEVEPKLRAGRSLVAHLRGLDLDAQGLYVWAAGERGLVKDVRRVVRGVLGLGRSQQFSQFYWFADKPTG